MIKDRVLELFKDYNKDVQRVIEKVLEFEQENISIERAHPLHGTHQGNHRPNGEEMKLERLQLENFRQYYGRQRLTFARDAKRNVTVIHGINGAAKTSLFSAIN
jgi:hypothetical protein